MSQGVNYIPNVPSYATLGNVNAPAAAPATASAVGGATGIGNLVGSVLGGVAGIANLGLGIYNTSQENKRRREAQRSINSWEADAKRILAQAQQNQVNLSNPGDLRRYQELKRSYNPNDYVYDFDEFDKSKYNVEDYLNKNRQAILDDVAKTMQHTAAGSAMGHSSGAAQAMMASVANKDEELFNQAYQQLNTERSFDYNAYTNYINQKQNQLNNIQQGIINQMQMLQGDIQFDQNQNAQNVNNQLSLGNSIAQARASLV